MTAGTVEQVTAFAKQLRLSILEAQDGAIAATEARHPYEAYLHRARITELLDLAASHDIAIGALVQPAIRDAMAADRAALGA